MRFCAQRSWNKSAVAYLQVGSNPRFGVGDAKEQRRIWQNNWYLRNVRENEFGAASTCTVRECKDIQDSGFNSVTRAMSCQEQVFNQPLHYIANSGMECLVANKVGTRFSLLHLTLSHTHSLGRFAKLRKRLLALPCLSVRPSVWNNSTPTAQIFITLDIWVFFENMFRQSKFDQNPTRIADALHSDLCIFISRSNLLRLGNFSKKKKSYRKSKNILNPITFFPPKSYLLW